MRDKREAWKQNCESVISARTPAGEFVFYRKAAAEFESPNETGKSPVQIEHAELIAAQVNVKLYA